LTANLDDVNEILDDSRGSDFVISEPELSQYRLLLAAGLVLLQKEAAASNSDLYETAKRIVPGDPEKLDL
jgi:hypothetical protein